MAKTALSLRDSSGRRLLLWALFLLINVIERLRRVVRAARWTGRVVAPQPSAVQSEPSHVALVGAETELKPIIDELVARGVQKVTVYDWENNDVQTMTTCRTGASTIVRLGPENATRRYLVSAALGQCHAAVADTAYKDEPDLLLTLDGHLHGYPATALRVTHLYHLSNVSSRGIDEALSAYMATERRQGR